MVMKKIAKSITRRLGYELSIKRRRIDESPPPYLFDQNYHQTSNKLTQEVTQTILNFFDEVDPLYADVRGPLAIRGAWREDLLKRRKKQLRILNERKEGYDEYEYLLLNMFRNELVSGLWNYEYYQTACKRKFLSYQFLNDLRGFEYLTTRTITELAQSSFLGNPWGLRTKSGIIKYPDPWHGIQADSVINLLKSLSSTQPESQKATVVDLGFGFGGSIEKIARWHKYPAQYVLIDIPMNLTSAYAYISFCFPKSEKTIVSNSSMLMSTMNNDTKATNFIFVPSLFVEEFMNCVGNVNVLLNAGSLSEMDYETVEFYLKNLVTENTNFFIEWNSNAPKENTGGHIEIPSSKFPVPNSHRLLSRNPVWRSCEGNRYLNSIWVNSNFFETAEGIRIDEDNN